MYIQQDLKKLVFFISLIVMSGHIMAQNDFQIEPQGPVTKPTPVDTANLWHGFYIAPAVAIGSASPDAVSGVYKSGTNINLGGELSYMFHSGFGISAGLQYEQYSYNYVYSSLPSTNAYGDVPTTLRSTTTDTSILVGYTPNVTYSYSFIKLPLLVRYASGHVNKVNFYVEAGVSPEFLISKKVSGSVTETIYNLTQAANTNWYHYSTTSSGAAISVSESNADVAAFNLAFHLGIGLTIPIDAHTAVIAEYSPEYGLMNSGTGENDMIKDGNIQYYFFGKGNYGSIGSRLLTVKVLFTL
jgi:hypothetical protein